ncbi:helix-turn-helix transcriptional regulator [Sinorhizobium sp. 8-89]|uniref:helix-turn-helix transcriptional regulator n=1 Tax=Sinorhizobium sp. 7-81 TaxID=3049087 RepID=UPI0024C259B2|nr:helix-turn-helix transcriptional regulator [Sinorhizobium sp. 7-81]
MAVLQENHRRYDLYEELETALNRVDFFRIFHTLALRFGFGHFGVLQLGNENDACMLSARLVLHDLPSGLAEEYDKRYRFGDSIVYRALHASNISSVWRADDPVLVSGQNLPAQLGFELLLCVPVSAATTGARYAVLFFGDGGDLGQAAHYELCYSATSAFDYFHRATLANKAGMGLTPRETEILKWISHGKTASEIALIVSVSEHTVNSHTATILKKLDVVNRTQMVAKAIREQIIQ